ncbi:MAG: trans-aconitate 2-methyltransferase [Mycobacteriales bacterium]
MWDPARYGRYAEERGRPYHEVVARVAADRPAVVVDLGCGDGSLTATLAGRWPEASVLGVDSSAAMLADAAGRATARLRFALGRIEDWRPDQPVDVLVSNAALHWVPDHRSHLPRLLGLLAPGGWLAIQMPGNTDAPSHRLLAELRRSPRWKDRLDPGPQRWPDVADPADYARQLLDLGCRVDAWETTYVHVLGGTDPVLDWTRGTALRPVLAQLPAADAADFEAEYAGLLRSSYPTESYGTVVPFRRVFFVAQRD